MSDEEIRQPDAQETEPQWTEEQLKLFPDLAALSLSDEQLGLDLDLPERDELTPKERCFVMEYVSNGMNGTGAARKTGYSHPHMAAYRLLQRPRVQAAVAEEREGNEHGPVVKRGQGHGREEARARYSYRFLPLSVDPSGGAYYTGLSYTDRTTSAYSASIRPPRRSCDILLRLMSTAGMNSSTRRMPSPGPSGHPLPALREGKQNASTGTNGLTTT